MPELVCRLIETNHLDPMPHTVDLDYDYWTAGEPLRSIPLLSVTFQ